MAIDSPGVYQIPEAEYHADPCPQPSLSSSIARIIVQESPLHAWNAHPRLNRDAQQEEASHLDTGSLCHALMLEGEDKAVIIDADNYRTKAAQEARDNARLVGLYPILAREMDEVHLMMKACRLQLDAHADAYDAFTNGKPEQTLIWQEPNGIWCRARLDWIMLEKPVVYDYKTSGRSARPASLSRIAAANGWCIQDSFYCRGFKAVFGIDPTFRFVAQENYRPFALSVIETSPADRALADVQAQYAIDTFGDCLKSGVWPGYSRRVERITSPPYVESAWLDEQLKEQK